MLAMLPVRTPFRFSSALPNSNGFLLCISSSTLVPLGPSIHFAHSLYSLAHLKSRTVVSIKGSNASTFLQNLITQQIQLLHPPSLHPVLYTAFLNPQGRFLYDGFISLDPTCFETYYLDVHTSHLPSFLSHLRRYNLRSNVELNLKEWDLWYLFPSKTTPLSTQKSTFPSLSFSQRLHQHFMDPRIQGLGVWYYVEKNSMPIPSSDVTVVPEESYTLFRYRLGIPEGPDFVSGVSLPLEANIDYLNGVDFHKGCYVGQELTIRTHHTGVVRKRIVPVTLAPMTSSTFGDSSPNHFELNSTMDWPFESITEVRTDQGKVAGKLLTGYHSLGLGLIRLEYLTTGLHVLNSTQQPWMRIKAWKPDWWP